MTCFESARGPVAVARGFADFSFVCALLGGRPTRGAVVVDADLGGRPRRGADVLAVVVGVAAALRGRPAAFLGEEVDLAGGDAAEMASVAEMAALRGWPRRPRARLEDVGGVTASVLVSSRGRLRGRPGPRLTSG